MTTSFIALPVLALVLRSPVPHTTSRMPAPAMQIGAVEVVQTGGAVVLAALTFQQATASSKATNELKKVKAELESREKEVAEAKLELQQLREVKASSPEDDVSRRQFSVIAATALPLAVGYFVGLSANDGDEVKATRLAKAEAQKAAAIQKAAEVARAREAKEAAKREKDALLAQAAAEQRAALQAEREAAAQEKKEKLEKLEKLIEKANEVEATATK